MNEIKKGKIFIISAPSGAGKSTLCKMILGLFPNMRYSVSYTTRASRIGEKGGIDYYFISKEDFINGIKQGRWAEWAEVHGNYYGTSVFFLDRELNLGNNILLDIDVQGTIKVIEKYPDSVTIFIMPPSFDILRQRLISRGTDSPETIEKRLINAKNEIAENHIYQHIVVNDQLHKALNQLKTIIEKFTPP